MMIKDFYVNEFRYKLSLLIKNLYVKNSISLNNISEKIIESKLFDFEDEKNIKYVFDMSYEEFVFELFQEHAKNISNDIVSEIIWAINSYLTISLNLFIPFKRIVLLCPITEMIKLYPIYHEMDERQLIDYFNNNILNKNILKTLRLKRKLTVNELSYLSDVNKNSIKRYEKDNESIYSASLTNINSLASVLKVDLTVFFKNSNTTFYDHNLLKLEEIVDYMNEYISLYFQKDTKLIFDGLVFIAEIGNKKKYLKELEIENAYRFAVRKYIDNNKKIIF